MDDKKMEEQFDELWTDAVERSYQIDIPDSRSSWDKVRQKLAAERVRRMRIRRIQMIAAISVSLIVGAVVFGSPEKTKAFNPLNRFMQNLKGDIVTLFRGNDDPAGESKTSPPPPEFSTQKGGSKEPGEVRVGERNVISTMEEARNQAPFALAELGYLPAGYKFLNVKLQKDSRERVVQAILLYAADGGMIYLTEMPLPLDFQSSRKMEAAGTGEKSVKLNGKDGKLVSKEDGRKSLVWVQGDTLIEMIAPLPEEELVKMANHMK